MSFAKQIADAHKALAQADSLDEELPMRRMANAIATEPNLPLDTRTRQTVDQSVATLSEMVGLLKDMGWQLQQAVMKTNRPDTVRDVITELSQAVLTLSNLRDKIQIKFRVEENPTPDKHEGTTS